MRYVWDEQQSLLRAMLERFAGKSASSGGRDTKVDRATWKELAELGVLGLPFSEEDGGSAGSALDVLIVMEAFGRGLVRLPYFSAIVLAGGALRHSGDAAAKARLLPPLIAGDLLLALAFAEAEGRYNPAFVATTARADGDGYRLSGRKIAALGAPEADACVITARTSGDRTASDGVSLFFVPREKLELHSHAIIDGTAAAEIVLEDVRVSSEALIGPRGQALPIMEQALSEATAAICADAVGAMEALNRKCVEYAQTRRAFGQTLAQFQAIQHRLVDMHIAHEMAAAITLKAAEHISNESNDVARVVAACKALVSEEAAFVGKSAVQLHGAIGITEELDIGLYFKRLTAMQLMLGGADHHMRNFARINRQSETMEARHGH